MSYVCTYICHIGICHTTYTFIVQSRVARQYTYLHTKYSNFGIFIESLGIETFEHNVAIVF
jgi:hypothetical protein